MSGFSAPSEGSDIMDKFVEEINNASKSQRAQIAVCHIYLEHFLMRLIEESHPDSDTLLERTYLLDKAKILYAMGIINDKILNDLKIINEVRNQLIHNLDPNQEQIKEKCKKLFFPEIINSNITSTGHLLESAMNIMSKLNDARESKI